MIGDIILAVFAILLYIDAWWGYRKNTKEIDDLRDKYSIANETIRDLKTRIRFLEMEEERRKRIQALPEVESETHKI